MYKNVKSKTNNYPKQQDKQKIKLSNDLNIDLLKKSRLLILDTAVYIGNGKIEPFDSIMGSVKMIYCY